MKKFESLGEKLSKAEQKSIKGGAVDGNGVACVCGDGTEVGIIDCGKCYTWCNDKGGISCSDGDCKDWNGGSFQVM